MILNRRLFLIGSTAALAVATLPRLIVPGQAAPVALSQIALPDGAIERAITYLYATALVLGPREGVMRLGHLGARRPHVVKAFSELGNPDWYATPDEYLYLTPRHPIAVLDWEGVPPGGAVVILNFLDRLADGSTQGWIQERTFEWGSDKATEGKLEEGDGVDGPLMSDFEIFKAANAESHHHEQAEARSRARTPVADRVARYRRGDFS